MVFLTVYLDRNLAPAQEFFRELSGLGYTEGKTLEVERLSINGNSELREELARKAVREMPDVIFVITGPLTKSVKDVSGTIPIACMTADPIALGLTTSLAKPSGNVLRDEKCCLVIVEIAEREGGRLVYRVNCTLACSWPARP
jgi:putative ABC transport system substrate-binding protein